MKPLLLNIKSLLISIVIISSLCCKPYESMNKIKDYVPDEETAIKIAEAIWLPIYGEDVLKKKPYKATLINNEFWRVEGSLEEEELGGVPIIEIRKTDCKILKVTHGK
jgi:hypothetical protein